MISRKASLIKKGIDNPRKVPSYLRRKIIFPVQGEINRISKGIKKQKPMIEDFVSKEEFVLVILDACRYDYFSDNYSDILSGDLGAVWSSASWTGGYVEQTWTGKYNLTYISAAPHVSDFSFRSRNKSYRPSEHIDTIIDVWDNHWNPLLGTTPAEDVTDVSLAVAAKSRNTRLVVHYMQPHSPYIGNTKILPWGLESDDIEELNIQNLWESKDIPDTLDNDILSTIFEENLGARELEEQQMTLPTHTIKNRIDSNSISKNELRAAYRDNLRYVLKEVKRLVERVNCPVVVTADHGEFLGERDLFFHPKSPYVEGRQVPWLTVNNTTIGTAPIEERFYEKVVLEKGKTSEEEIENKLAALGYREPKNDR